MSVDRSGRQGFNSWYLVIVLILVLIIVGILFGAMGCMGNVAAIDKVADGKLTQFTSTYCGIEYATNKIIKDDTDLPDYQGDSYNYSLIHKNGNDINITIEYIDKNTYKVSSLYMDSNGTTTSIANYISIDKDRSVDKG